MSGSNSTEANGRSMESRVGRSKQRYNAKGFRLVAGVVPLSPDQEFVLLIQSTRRKGWVLPKGGWEIDESCQEAAVREAWEEAGITIEVEFELGTIEELRPPKMSKDQSQYHFFQGTVVSQYEEWPESHKRERQWFTFSQAIEALSTRPELQEALNRSGIKRMLACANSRLRSYTHQTQRIKRAIFRGLVPGSVASASVETKRGIGGPCRVRTGRSRDGSESRSLGSPDSTLARQLALAGGGANQWAGAAMENLSISEPPHQGGAAGGVAAPAQLPPQMFTTAAQLLDLTDKRIFAPSPASPNSNNSSDPDAASTVAPSGGLYADIFHGIFLVRGENVLLLGEIDLDKDDLPPPGYEQGELELVKRLAEERKTREKRQEKTRVRKLAKLGFEGDGAGEVVLL
ncbi:hypothetical protein PWT90_01454 [Aphanocladium album]|nr:hypothetical protein PWT90_01454 [Aphanocladium album]